MQRNNGNKQRDDESAGSSDSELQHQQRILQDVDIEKLEKFIKESGRNLNELFVDGESLLNLVCAAGYTELAKALLSMRLNVNDLNSRTDRTPLMEAAQNAHVDTVRLLLAHGADVNAKGQSGNTALHNAVLSTNIEVCRWLIEYRADVNAINETGHTPLMEAASANLVQLAELLIRAGADVNLYSPEFKETALTLAAYKGHTAMCELLVRANASVHHRTDETHTALMEACIDGHVETVRTLHRLGAAVCALPDGYETPLTLAASGGHLELVSALIELGAPIDEPNEDGCTPLMEAAREGHLPVVMFLEARGANVFYVSEDQQETALTVAASAGHVQVVEHLLQLFETTATANDCPDEPSWIDQGGQTALVEAAMEGHLDVCHLLIAHGASLELANPNGDTALSAACENGGCLPIVQALIEVGANVNAVDETGCSALMKAVRSENVDVVRALLAAGADPNAVSLTADCSALLLAVEKQSVELVRLLLDATADPAKRYKDSTTALIEAARLGASSVVDLLLDYPTLPSPDPAPTPTPTPAAEAPDAGQSTSAPTRPRCKAVARRTHKTTDSNASRTTTTVDAETPVAVAAAPVVPLVDVNAETDTLRETALSVAAGKGHLEMVCSLLRHGAAVDHRDKKGNTPLIVASAGGHVEICRVLLAAGATVDAHAERAKDTALIIAAQNGRETCVQLLIEHGANVEHRNFNDYTALCVASMNGHRSTVQLLLNLGAEINARTNSKLGISPLMLAAMQGHAAVVTFLLEHGADVNAQIETNRNTALTLACVQGRNDVVRLLIERRANAEHRGKNGFTPLMEACHAGHTDVVRTLLEFARVDVNAPPVPGTKETALSIAAERGHRDIVELLVAAGGHLESRTKKGATPLWLAAMNGHLEIVQRLAAARADLYAEDARHLTPLGIAYRKGHVKVVKYLCRIVQHFPSDADLKKHVQTLEEAAVAAGIDLALTYPPLAAAAGNTAGVRQTAVRSGPLSAAANVKSTAASTATQPPSAVASQSKAQPKATTGKNGGQQHPASASQSRQSDTELLRCVRCCFELVRQAKERQAHEANRIATQLLEQLDAENEREVARRVAQKRKKEKKRLKKLGEKQRSANAELEADDDEDSAIKEAIGVDDNDMDADVGIELVASFLSTAQETGNRSRLNLNESAATESANVASSSSSKPGKRRSGKQQSKSSSTTAAAAAGAAASASQEQTAIAAVETPVRNVRSKATATAGTSKQPTRSELDSAAGASRNDDTVAKPHAAAAHDASTAQAERSKATSTSSASAKAQSSSRHNVAGEQVERVSSQLATLSVASGNVGAASSGSFDQFVTPNAPLQCSTHAEARNVYQKAKRIQVGVDLVQRLVGRNSCQLRVLEQLTGTFIEVENCQKRSIDRVMALRGPPDNVRCCALLIIASLKYPERPLVELVYACKRELMRSEITLSAIGSHPQQLNGELGSLIANIGRTLQSRQSSITALAAGTASATQPQAANASRKQPTSATKLNAAQPTQQRASTKWNVSSNADGTQSAVSNQAALDDAAPPAATSRPVAQIGPLNVNASALSSSSSSAEHSGATASVFGPSPPSNSSMQQKQHPAAYDDLARPAAGVSFGVSIGVSGASNLSVGFSGPVSVDVNGASYFSAGLSSESPSMSGGYDRKEAPTVSSYPEQEALTAATSAADSYSPFCGPCIDVVALLQNRSAQPDASASGYGNHSATLENSHSNSLGSGSRLFQDSLQSAAYASFDAGATAAADQNNSYTLFGGLAQPSLFGEEFLSSLRADDERDRFGQRNRPLWAAVDEAEAEANSQRSAKEYASNSNPLTLPRAGPLLNPSAPAFDPKRAAGTVNAPAQPQTIGSNLTGMDSQLFGPPSNGNVGLQQLGRPNASRNARSTPTQSAGGPSINITVQQPLQTGVAKPSLAMHPHPQAQTQTPTHTHNSVASAATQTVPNVSGATIMVTNVNNNNIYYCAPNAAAPNSHAHSVNIPQSGPYGPLDLPTAPFGVDPANSNNWFPPHTSIGQTSSGAGGFEPAKSVFASPPSFSTNVTVLPNAPQLGVGLGPQMPLPLAADNGLPVNLNLNMAGRFTRPYAARPWHPDSMGLNLHATEKR